MAINMAEGRGTVNHESRIHAVIDAGKEIIWMKEIVGELGIWQAEFRLYCDNQSVIHLAKNAAYHSRPSISKEDTISSESE